MAIARDELAAAAINVSGFTRVWHQQGAAAMAQALALREGLPCG